MFVDKKEREKRNEDEKKEKVQKAIEAKLASKSRLKLSIGKAQFEDGIFKDQFEGNKTGHFSADLYVGNHPNFNIGFNYQYTNFNDYSIEPGSEKSFIEEQAGGLSARVHFVLPFLFSTKLMPFVEGKAKYSSFKSKLQQDSKIKMSKNEWNGFFLVVDGGLEFVFNDKFSLFGQAGFNRVLKLDENLPKFEFLFIDAGIAIWF